MSIIFITVIIAEFLNISSLMLTLIFPKFRIWPPHTVKSWNFYFICTLNDIIEIGIILLGILDWNSFIIKTLIRLPFGIFLYVFGYWLFHESAKTLNNHFNYNGEDYLVIEGLYQYSRNPQYISAIIMITGMILITNSSNVLILGLFAMPWFILAPFTEESWLRIKFGKEYEEYCKEVRRFI